MIAPGSLTVETIQDVMERIRFEQSQVIQRYRQCTPGSYPLTISSIVSSYCTAPEKFSEDIVSEFPPDGPAGICNEGMSSAMQIAHNVETATFKPVSSLYI